MMGAAGEPSGYYPMDSNGLAVQSELPAPCVCPVVQPQAPMACPPLGYGGCENGDSCEHLAVFGINEFCRDRKRKKTYEMCLDFCKVFANAYCKGAGVGIDPWVGRICDVISKKGVGIYARRPTYGSHLQNAGSFAPKLRNQAALIVLIVANSCVSGKMARYKKEASLAAIRSVNVGNLSLTKLSEGVMRKSTLLIMGILVGLIFILLAHLIWTSQSHAQSPLVKHIERIGAIHLGILLPLPGDAQLVGLNILDCTQTRNRDVAYIFVSDYSVASLRSIYETEMRNAEVKWSVKTQRNFPLPYFKKGASAFSFHSHRSAV